MALDHSFDPRTPTITHTRKGPIINLISWIALATMCLAVATVLVTKLVVFRKLRWESTLITAALIFSIGFTISINLQVEHGLGSPFSTMDEHDYLTFQRTAYASNLFYILTLYFSKTSTVTLLLGLAPNKRYRTPMLGVGAIILVWAFTSILGSAFQCSMPDPWRVISSKCFNQVAFWTTVAVVDILTDVAIMALPVYLIYSLKLPLSKKLAVCFAFSFRIFDIGCAIFRLTQLTKYFDRDSDISFESWIPTIATVLEVFSSVFATCVPHLKPFIVSIQAGYLSGVVDDKETRFGFGNDSFLIGRTVNTRSSSSTPKRSAMSDRPRNSASHQAQRQKSHVQAISETETVLPTEGRENTLISDNDNKLGRQCSDSSTSNGSEISAGSQAMVIKTTKGWSVTYQDGEEGVKKFNPSVPDNWN